MPDPDASFDQILLYILVSITEGRVTANAGIIFKLLSWTCELTDIPAAEKQFTDLLAHLDLSQGKSFDPWSLDSSTQSVALWQCRVGDC